MFYYLTMILAANVMSRSQNCGVGTELSSGGRLVFIRPGRYLVVSLATRQSSHRASSPSSGQPAFKQDNSQVKDCFYIFYIDLLGKF